MSHRGKTASALVVAAAFSGLFIGNVAAQTRAVPQTRADVQASFAPVVKSAAPAVVNVYGARVERRPQNPFMDDPFFRRFFGDGGFGVPRERVQQSLGSGVIVDAGGLVVTNHHVIEGMAEVKVALADKREFEAEIVLRDPRSDLAVLRMKPATGLPLAALPIGEDDRLEVGDLVLAIGNPFGVGQTVTQGIVSALARTQVGVTDYQSFIQTDAAINPGNSGGALVDMQGRLVGINTAIFSRSGGSHGIGFAIPAGMVRIVIDSARTGSKTVRRPWFGARLQAVTSEAAESLGLDRPAGVLVARVEEKGPAAEAGLRRSDVILQVDGQNVDDPDAFGYRFATRAVGGTAQLGIMRAGRRLTLPVRLQAAPETRPREALTLDNRSPLAGAQVMNMSPAVRRSLASRPAPRASSSRMSRAVSAANRVGFRKGDIVLAINGVAVATTRALETATRDRKRFWEDHHQPRWPGADQRLRRVRPVMAGLMSDLFDASNAAGAPRPLADRLRPRALARWRAGDLSGDGALTRLIASGSLGPDFLGAAGTGKTTVARLLANETSLAFVQISAIFWCRGPQEGVRRGADASRVAVARCSSSMKFIASTARSLMPSCLSWKTARSRLSARRPRIHLLRSTPRCSHGRGCSPFKGWMTRQSPRCWPARKRRKAGAAADAGARAAFIAFADGDGRAALTLAEELWRAAKPGETLDAQAWPTRCNGARRSMTRRRTGTTISSARCTRPCAAPIPMRRCITSHACSMPGKIRAFSHGAWCAWPWRISGLPIRRRWSTHGRRRKPMSSSVRPRGNSRSPMR